MELFKLLGTIKIDNDGANKALDETSEKGKGTASKLGSAFGKIGKGALAVGTAVGSGVIAAGTAVAGLVTQSVSAYAEYEQLVGGVETLFKDSAGQVMEYANNAFKTAGMSANEYMTTVTSFSASLLQSLGGDTAAATEKANMAITDMSDNANKMGTSMEMIQNAYNGFAKQNYTMLDNLKLGYGGTKEEMQRLLEDATKLSGIEYDISSYGDIVDAIHVIQTEMGITGTTAKEASSTISGSIGMMKASWTNLITAMSDKDADLNSYMTNLVDSVSTVIGNLLPVVETALTGAVRLINDLAPAIIEKIPGLLEQLLPSLITAATNIITSLAGVLPSLITMLTTSVLPQLITAILSIADAILAALPTVISAIASALPSLVQQLLLGAIDLIVSLCTYLPQIIQPIISMLPDLLTTVMETLLGNLDVLVQGLIGLAVASIPMIPEILHILLNAFMITFGEQLMIAIIELVPVVLVGMVQLVWALVKALPSLLWALVKAFLATLVGTTIGALKAIFEPILPWIDDNVIQPVIGFFKKLWDGLKVVWDGICDVVSIAVKLIASILDAAFQIITLPFRFIWENCKEYVFAAWEFIKKLVTNYINNVKTVITTVMNAIKIVFSTVWNAVKTVFTTVWNAIVTFITPIINKIKTVITTVFNAVKTYITTVLNFYKTIFTTVWNAIRTTISTVVGNIKDRITTVFNAVKNTVGNIFNSIKEKMTAPIQKARDTIKGIVDRIKGFFSGMNISFPHIKLPHFSISPSGWKIGDLLEGSVPKLGISWYAKAMNDPMIMNRPTIFGYDASTGKLMGGGEAGSEVVSGTETLMNMIQAAVAAQNEAVVKVLTAILNAIVDGNQETLHALLADKTFTVGEREFARLVRQYA